MQLVGSALDRRLDYVLGAYYFDENGESADYSAITGRPRVDRVATIYNRAYALYGQATLRPAFVEGLYLTGGLRWSRDEREATLDQTIVPATGAPTVLPHGEGKNHFSNLSPSFVIGYNATPNLNIYAKYARGYKTGGYNIRASSIARFNEGFGPETLDSFELGVKASWLDNHLQTNVALFRSNYKDIQTNIQSDPTNVAITDVFNAGKARIQGFELDLIAKPIDALTLTVNYAYLDAKFQQILDQAGNDISTRYTFVEAPKHTLTTSLEYRFPDTPIGILTANIDYFLKSKVSTSTADPRYVIGDYGLLNARLTLSDIPVGFGNWRLSAFGKNLTDEEYYIAHFNGGLPSAIFGDPRTYGLELTFEY